jgi:hypothetical protein
MQDAAGSYNNGSGGSAAGIPMLKFDAAAIGGGGGTTTTLPPEQEQKVDFLAPRAGARYVYVANPSRNTVSVIDSKNLTVTEVAPGDSPTYVTTVPGQDIALVINAGSHTLGILHGDEMPGGPIPIVAKANAISISPDGMHAVIWFDASQVNASTSSTTSTATATSTLTTGSTQEVSVVTLSDIQDTVISMTVGYNPSAVVFSNDNTAAFVVTDDGISELRFANITGPGIAPFTRIDQNGATLVRADAGAPVVPSPDAQIVLADNVTPPVDGGVTPVDTDNTSIDGGEPSSLDGGRATPDLGGGSEVPDTAPVKTTPDTAPVRVPAASGKPIDVSVTADGAYAVARREGSSELVLVNLKTRTVSSLQLSSPVTDLDVLPSGTQAYAVLRDESKLVRIDIPGDFATGPSHAPWQFEGLTIGSVTMSSKGKYALLYTTATTSNSIVIFDLAKESPQTVSLHKSIRAIAIAPDENTALVLHTNPTASGSGGTAGTSTADKSYYYTLVHLEDGFTKLQQTAAEPNPFAITPTSSHAFVLLRDDKNSVRIAERISLTSFLTDDFPLGSPPNSIAALSEASQKVFVGQVHPEGRISFIDWMTGSVQSVTGFALSGRIQQ